MKASSERPVALQVKQGRVLLRHRPFGPSPQKRAAQVIFGGAAAKLSASDATELADVFLRLARELEAEDQESQAAADDWFEDQADREWADDIQATLNAG